MPSKPKSTISGQQAVHAALDYVHSVYPQPLEGLTLEELELSKDRRYWLVTVGFWQPKPKSPLDKEIDMAKGGLVLTIPTSQMLQVFKVVKVDAASGAPVSMKIREP